MVTIVSTISSYLVRLSPSYRAAQRALRMERARVLGYARYVARREMMIFALAEHADDMERAEYLACYGYAGPLMPTHWTMRATLPRCVWQAVAVMA